MPARLTIHAQVALCIAGLAALLVGCDSLGGDEDSNRSLDPRIEIRRHVDTFRDEANQRGKDGHLFNPDALQIVVQNVVERGGEELCGLGGVTPDSRPEIIIATNEGCWDRTASDREILVFHELGHALLGRQHIEKTLPNGLRGTIMVDGNIFGLYSEARAEWRRYYVDELFDPDTPAPTWSVE